jgi:hypothetical protein
MSMQVPFRSGPSTVIGAGDGLFLLHDTAPGTILSAPLGFTRTWSLDEVLALPEDCVASRSSVRWFADRYTCDERWEDEAYINHSFAPNALWHLGFIFAIAPIPAGAEVFMDYRLVMGEDERCGFVDGATGQMIRGLPARETLLRSTRALLAALES